MSLLIVLAWRNLWRNTKRTLLTVVAISFSAAVLMFFMGIQFKSYEAGIKATTALFHGHGQIQTPGFSDKPQMRLILRNPAAIEEMLRKEDNILAFTPRNYGFVLASSGERSYGAQILGVDPLREDALSTIPQSIRSGSYLDSADTESAVIGSVLAKNLKISVGNEITILGQAHDGSLVTAALYVKGIFETGSTDLDRGMIHITISSFNDLFVMNGAVHTFAFTVKDFPQLTNTQLSLSTSLQSQHVSNARVLRWDELLPGLKQSIQLDMSAGWLFFSALIIIVFFSVLNTFLMSILERTKEFGVVMALGMTPPKLSLLILIEAFFLGIIGALGGILIGSGVVLFFHWHGFTIPGTEEIRKMWHLPATIYPDLTLTVLFAGPAVLLVAACISALYPSFRVRLLSPIKALTGL